MGTFNLSMALVIAGVLALFLLGLLIGLALGKRGGRLEAEKELPSRLSAEREDAVKRSRAVLGGQVAEQLAPYLPGFPCPFDDARFLGKPLDYVCFNGASSGEVEEIVFVEVKTGDSSLSKVEKSARQAIIDGRVRWVEYRIPLD
jgi:predicted Holliday junction resolvase-like endonuclease